MKYIWPALNTVLIFMVFMYVFISKDINTKAYDECKVLETQLNEQRELTNKVIEEVAKKDTVIIYINNKKF
jgi:hypothetical protein